ncbi:MAG TPA: flagellar hook-length control protein FliK [Devosia sp.]|nr:flagellar hook-length control protein FliK [Devosia sp.]
MTVPALSLTSSAAARAGLAEALLIRAGQVLEALVLSTAADGTATLRIANQLVAAKLPATLPAGTVLELQVKSPGPQPEFVVLRQSPPAPAHAEAPIAAPTPAALPAATRMEAGRAAAVAAEPPESAARAMPRPGPGVATPAPAPAKGSAESRSGPAVPETAEPAAAPVTNSPGRGAAAITPDARRGSHAEGSAAGPAAFAQETPTESGAGASISPPRPAGASVGDEASAGPGRPVAGNAAPMRNVETALRAVATQAAQALGAAAAIPPSPSTATPAPAISAATPAAYPAATSAVYPEAPAAAIRTAEGSPVQASQSALLMAQTMPRAAATMADLPKPPALPPSAPNTTIAEPPASPQAALAQAVPQAMARQDSLGPLMISLTAAIARPGLLEDRLQRLAIQILNQRVTARDGRVSADELARAVTRSGVMLEASLAAGRAEPLDLKSLLVALRERLADRGPEPPDRPGVLTQPAPPPLKGLALRAAPGDAPALPTAPRDAMRQLHDQSDAAVARIKLAQIASLPDGGDAGKPATPMLRLEVPLLFGHELVMAQMQVAREGRRRGAEGRRGWTLRFALNSTATGEVGADVGLLGKSVTVSLWAAEPETAEALRAGLPELAGALEAAGLTASSLRLARGLPARPRPPAGKLVDSVS